MTIEMQVAIIGVLGTLGGTILGWFLNNLSQSGRLNIYVSSWEEKLKFNNQRGEMEESTSKEQTEYYEYRLSLDLYNSSGEPKIMRNIKILFMENKRKLFESSPKDDATKRIGHPVVFYDDVSVVNVPAKTVIKLNLHSGFWKERKQENMRFDALWKSNRIYLQYTNENNKNKSIKVKQRNLNDYFCGQE